jgi:AraC family transcriptional regulator
MDNWMFDSYEEPRFVDGEPIILAGYRGTFTPERMGEIAEMWMRFGDGVFGHVPSQVNMVGYGVSIMRGDAAGGFDYLAAVEVSDPSSLSDEYSVLEIPAKRYAVFTHPHHVSEFGKMINTIVQKYFPTSGYGPSKLNGDSICIERYGEEFDPTVGVGNMEIWFPIEPVSN